MATVAMCVTFEIALTVVRVALIIADMLSVVMVCRRAIILVLVPFVFLKHAPRVMVPCMLPTVTITVFMVILVLSLHQLEGTSSHSCT